MGCNCGNRAKAAAAYPRTAVMPDGSRVEVTSAQHERTERARVQARMAARNGTGYTARYR